MYYDKEAKPINAMEWMALFDDPNYQRISRTEIGDYIVSTVWLGLDHNYGDGDPVIFETMVFDKKGDDVGQRRYCTLAQAARGHMEMVVEAEELASRE